MWPADAWGYGEDTRLLARSIFIKAQSREQRLWAMDLALRSPAVAALVGDASGLDLASTRRLQLAAEARGGFALLARPPDEQSQLSAAGSRWRVARLPSDSQYPRWQVQLLRAKPGAIDWPRESGAAADEAETDRGGSGDEAFASGAFAMEWHGAKGVLVPVSSDVVDRPDSQAVAQGRRIA